MILQYTNVHKTNQKQMIINHDSGTFIKLGNACNSLIVSNKFSPHMSCSTTNHTSGPIQRSREITGNCFASGREKRTKMQ